LIGNLITSAVTVNPLNSNILQNISTASKANGGHNKINPIGDKNPNKAKYIQAADYYLKR
jgi:hypothetical protein